MLVELEIQHLKTLKLILQYNLLFVILGIFCFIYFLFFTVVIKYESKYTGDETIITGTIQEYSINGNKLKLTILGKEKIVATYYMKSWNEKEHLLEKVGIGKTINVRGSIQEPLNNTIPNNFNYKKYLYNQKIFYQFDIDTYEIVDDSNFLNKIKDYLIKRAYNLENGDYLLVLVLGDKSLVSSDEYNQYQTNGTSHLLAISGSHVAVLLAIFGVLLKKVKEIPKLIILSIILIFFGFITGFEAAVNRAIVFFIISQINKIFNLHYSNLHILLITAYLLILINPFIVYDLGFLYSFVVCGGIIYNQDKITGNYITKLLKLSVISFLYSLPISAYINYEVNITSILGNMVFVPWISMIVFPLAIITFIIPFLNPLFSITLNITSFLNELFIKISLFINIPKVSLLIVLILLFLIILAKNNFKYYLFLVLAIIGIKIYPKLNNNFYVYFLDVGQGDSTLLISPYQKEIVLVDTGGKIKYAKEEWEESNKTYNLSDNTIKFLKSLGITKLDYLITTHGDYDHLGEAINIVDNMKIERVIFNNNSYNDLELELIEVLKNKKIKYYQNILSLDYANSKMYFLNTKIYDDENTSSNVIYLNYWGVQILLMGDASIATEQDILEKYNLKNIDILKVGHHGSKTSSDSSFIDSITPKYSVISVGRNNRYNHPNKEVLDNLDKSIIYRTDINGTIKFIINKNRLDIITYDP